MDLLPHGLLSRLDQTPFLTACRAGSIPRWELEFFLIQQYHYSRHFTRYLCALMANLHADEDRQALTENLFEEMGRGDLGLIPHSQIYRDMLRSLHLDPISSAPKRATVTLVETMLRLCASPEPMHGLGALCLGAEAIVPHIYSQVMMGLRARGFPEEHLTFFPLHIDGDDNHAITMKGIIDRELARSPEKLAPLQAAATKSISARIQFFEALSHPTEAVHAKALSHPTEAVHAI
jgi:pyrroloquinoline quinone (PQQ) biosynthesis protein C